jgi:hypothetical protein
LKALDIEVGVNRILNMSVSLESSKGTVDPGKAQLSAGDSVGCPSGLSGHARTGSPTPAQAPALARALALKEVNPSAVEHHNELMVKTDANLSRAKSRRLERKKSKLHQLIPSRELNPPLLIL